MYVRRVRTHLESRRILECVLPKYRPRVLLYAQPNKANEWRGVECKHYAVFNVTITLPARIRMHVRLLYVCVFVCSVLIV